MDAERHGDRGAARAMLEGERPRTDQVDCYACMWVGFPMPGRDYPEVKDAHWDPERNVYKSLYFSRAEHKRLERFQCCGLHDRVITNLLRMGNRPSNPAISNTATPGSGVALMVSTASVPPPLNG
jgi:hypothetical protein